MSKLFKNDTDVEVYIASPTGHTVRIKPGVTSLVPASMEKMCSHSPLTPVKEPTPTAKIGAKPTVKK